MKQAKQFLFLLALLVFFSESNINAQTEEFPIGAYLTSGPPYQNYWQVKQLGLNSVFQRCIVSIPSIGQESNFESLMQFNPIIAGNDLAPAPTVNENNVDWIYYFTNALYSKWEAEGSTDFFDYDPVGVKHNSGTITPNLDGWSSGNNAEDIGKFFILGPNYVQYMKYVYTNKFGNNDSIEYETNFRIKLAQAQTGTFPVARLIVEVMVDTSGFTTILVDSIIYSNQLTTAYQDFNLNYNYEDFISANNGQLNYTGTPPSGPAWYAPKSVASTSFINNHLKIQFKVQRLAAPEIIVDYIEVYDAGDKGIWKGWFTATNYQEMVSRITSYNQKFSSLDTNLKYYHTIDEPSSIDCYVPIQKVQSILDSLNLGRDLITHFYPGWNNYKDSVDSFEKWVNIAQPKKLMFWYFPYWVGESDETGLGAFGDRLRDAARLQSESGFYSTVQTWGYKKDGTYYWYRSPNPIKKNI